LERALAPDTHQHNTLQGLGALLGIVLLHRHLLDLLLPMDPQGLLAIAATQLKVVDMQAGSPGMVNI